MHKNKISVLFICPYPVGQSPSQRFRFEQYFNLLQVNGISTETRSFLTPSTWQILYKPGNSMRKALGILKGFLSRIVLLPSIRHFDFVFIHREATPIGPPWFEWIIAKILKKKIIYDFDDAIWLSNTSIENRIVASLKWHSKVASICRWSYKVSCGNSFLAGYAIQYNKNVVINPTTIDTLHLHNPIHSSVAKKESQVVIGWTGSQSTLPYILSLIPVIKKLEEKFPGRLRLLIIANKDPQLNLEFVDFIPWSKHTEAEDLLRIDIGVMPLSNDSWAKGKCGFKALQYMALEIPALVSPVGVNTEIVDNDVNGYWCTTETDWKNSLVKLIRNPELRRQMGLAGRAKVISHYSVSSNSSTFLDLLS